ncbi:MAG: ParB/RepB/Spo0J family partition protein, partial [Candidatus Eisenbacteria bacterium]
MPIEHLVPHPLNANVLPDDLREKLAAHIRSTGRYPHLIVRPHPSEPGKFQILDGHHRLLVLKEL